MQYKEPEPQLQIDTDMLKPIGRETDKPVDENKDADAWCIGPVAPNATPSDSQ